MLGPDAGSEVALRGHNPNPAAILIPLTRPMQEPTQTGAERTRSGVGSPTAMGNSGVAR